MQLCKALVLTLTLAACQPAPPRIGGPAGTCDAGAYSSLIGKPLAAVTLPAGLDLRVIEPDTAVTQEFRASRLNLRLDRQGRIEMVYCG
ncbi:MAG: I78 family peptidase inhibitor [Tranquillimonas sp.]